MDGRQTLISMGVSRAIKGVPIVDLSMINHIWFIDQAACRWNLEERKLAGFAGERGGVA
jgi:hypothetical protein